MKAYLTIDDSPSPHTDELVDALAAKNIQALLFCRGDLMDGNLAPIVRAIQKGMVVGNHGYWHKRASQLGFETTCESIDKTDVLIDKAYKQAGVARPGKYYRFAYMDRGMGAWFVEPDKLSPDHKAVVEHLVKTGLGNDPTQLPDASGVNLKNKLADHLKKRGYTQTPFKGIALPFYADTEMAHTIDAMFTFSTSDWAITQRHSGKYGLSSLDDLKHLVDSDPYLYNTDTTHIVLTHDQDETTATTIALVTYMLDKGFTFERLP